MRRTKCFSALMAILLLSAFMAEAQEQTVFEMSLGKEILQGTLSGDQGVFRVNYNDKNPFEVIDESGIIRGIYIDKIDRIEIAVPAKIGSAALVTIAVGDKMISGTFNGTDLYLKTDTERIELLKIKKGKVTLTRVSN